MRKPSALAAALAAGALLACGAPRPRPPSGAPALTVKGRVENGPFVFGTSDLGRLPRRAFRAQDPRTGRAVEVEGVSLAAVLRDEVALERGADTAAVRARDGYLAAIPLSVVRQLQPVLADRADGKPLPALRLAWPNLDWPGLETDPRIRFWWVEGAVEVDVLAWDRSFGRALRLPPGTGDAARLGADDFAGQCLGCHRVRGVGGERGPELTRVAERLRAGLEPRIKAHGLAEAHRLGAAPPAEGAPARIAAFLVAIDAAGPLPRQEERREEEPPAGPLRSPW
ncbi:hypothetical protein [Anaeromyxobacter paludicola]|uniref:Cytochrome c domain-containing protein n=1 Tax=Anaeromyxobacter paludicola TaxID=2918171 RepID=A0ABM7X764_9BACT|nr:hypothetical protein [Anaeromyxobacter paludicola]BDG07665.1 hypothetical protein AMPC_07780 [Anaeromyxobacter paludicola]